MTSQGALQVMGVGPVDLVAKGDRETVRATLKLCDSFRPTRFLVSTPNPELVLIHQIRIAGIAQIRSPSSAGVPASVWAPNKEDVCLIPWEGTLSKGQDIEIDISCIDVLHVLRVEYDLRTMQPIATRRFRRKIRFAAAFLGHGVGGPPPTRLEKPS